MMSVAIGREMTVDSSRESRSSFEYMVSSIALRNGPGLRRAVTEVRSGGCRTKA